MHRLVVLLVWLLLFSGLISHMIRAEQASTPEPTDLHSLLQPGLHTCTLSVDGRVRKYIFVTPAGFIPGQTLPIVFFFHGAGGNAMQASRTYGWVEKADQENFFAVFPEGLPVRPNEEASFILNPNIWRDERSEFAASEVKDVHFFSVLLAQLEAAVPIDPRRIYVTGFSNGAGMTFTLGGHFPDRIAAIAPISSQSFVRAGSLARPLPVYYLTGTTDPLIPYDGGSVALPWGQSRVMPPVQESVDTWTQLDGCPTEPQLVSDTNGVRVLRYGPGRDHAEIIFTTITGNGHHWPGTVEPLPPFISGPTLDPFNATDRIWDFFQAHPLP